MGDYEEDGDVCPIGGKQKGWSHLAGFGFNLAVDLLSKMVEPGKGLDHYIKSVTEKKQVLPTLAKIKVVGLFILKV